MGDSIAVELPRYVTSHPGKLSLANPPWVCKMNTSQKAVMVCGWVVKTGMARICWQVKLYMRDFM